MYKIINNILNKCITIVIALKPRIKTLKYKNDELDLFANNYAKWQSTVHKIVKKEKNNAF